MEVATKVVIVDKKKSKPKLGDLAKGFALRTTCHGVSRIAESSTRFRRAVWAAIVVASFVGYSVHVGSLAHKYFQYDVSIKLDVTTGDSVAFPAVTVCNSNKLRLSEVRKSAYADLAAIDDASSMLPYLGPCMPGDRACDDDNTICIKRYMWCNGIVDCANGVDETDCNSGDCRLDQYKCHNSKCLPLELKCNYRDDCGDNSDELSDANCDIRTCVQGEYQCVDTLQCIPLYMLCDGHKDCADGTDEPDFCGEILAGHRKYDVYSGTYGYIGPSLSFSSCPAGSTYIECLAGSQCLPTLNICDGVADCQIGLDESDCADHYFKCPYGKFKCSSGHCVSVDKVCDGVMDCNDGMDELLECDEVPDLDSMWQCDQHEQQSIPETLRCNGHPNCDNGADEQNCQHYHCPIGMIKCAKSHLCVAASKKCDGSYDCTGASVTDTTDEENCTNVECPVDKFQCDNGQCIDSTRRCDFFHNCLDGSDERNCTQGDCFEGDRMCGVSQEGKRVHFCLPHFFVCDGNFDCADDMDEATCKNYTCPDDMFQCGLKCDRIEKRCNLDVDCPRSTDEAHCLGQTCPDGFFRCLSGQCIRRHLYCDEPTIPDCADGSDEQYCDATCEDNRFQCASGWCVDSSLVCDGVNDCGDGSDERNCKLCSENEYTCKSGFDGDERILTKCLPRNRVCDRFKDCHFGDDEDSCEYAVYDVTADPSWYAKYEEISDDQNMYEEFRESVFVNRPTDFIPNEYPPLWNHFLVSSNTPDFSDLKKVLRLSREEIRQMGHQAEDLILQCTYDQRECSSSRDFYQFQDSVYGNCYTFNHGRNGTALRNASNTGSEFGLKLTLYTEQDEYVGVFGQESGVRFVVHDPKTTPFPDEEGLDAKTGTATSVIIKTRGEKRMLHPYGNCTNQAFTDNNAYMYSLLACQIDCLRREMAQYCGCVDNLYNDIPQCDVLNKTQDACRQLITFFYQKGKLNCDCQQQCSGTNYAKMMSLTSWPSSSYSQHLMSSLMAVNPKMKTLFSANGISNNLARLKIYYESLNVESIAEVEDYPAIQLLADFGGALGLWVGLSILTVVEFAEFIFDVCSRKKKRGSEDLELTDNM